MSIKHYLTYPFRWIGRSLLGMLLTSHGRRMILVASLYGHFKQVDVKKEKHEEFLSMINEIDDLFRITDKHKRALMMGLILHQNIWGNSSVPTKEEIDHHGKEVIYNDILREIPLWLRYDVDVLRPDVSFLIQYIAKRRVVVK